MTREKLRKIGSDERHSYCGTFERFGTAGGCYPTSTILLLDVKIINPDGTSVPVTDHLWFKCGKAFSKLNLQQGDQVFFNGRVAKYWKGYVPLGWQELDYKLERPTKVYKIDPSGNRTDAKKAHTARGMATVKQKEDMDYYGLKHTEATTSMEAREILEDFFANRLASKAMLSYRDDICAKKNLVCNSDNWNVVHQFLCENA